MPTGFLNSSSALYTVQEVKAVLSSHIQAKNLVNAHKQQFINVRSDDVLSIVLASKNEPVVPEFMKREDLAKRIVEKMQPWHRIDSENADGAPKSVNAVVLLPCLVNTI